MDRAEMGGSQLDKLAENIIGFPNLLGAELDLNPFMDEEISHRVKDADGYRDEVIKLLLGEDESSRGAALPWNQLRGKFEFRMHELTVWTGYKGHGKSAALSQVHVMFMKRGEKVFVISPEFRPAKVIERKIYQSLATRTPAARDVENFFESAKRQLWLYDNQASLKPGEVIALCRYAAKVLKVDHIVIDSLMKCGIAPDDYSAQKKFTDKIQAISHKYPLHIHMVAHARKGNSDDTPARLHDIKGTSEIADLAENVISVWRNKPKEKDPEKNAGMPDASLTIEAQRNGDGWIGTLNLMFDPDSMLFYEPGNPPERAEYVTW